MKSAVTATVRRAWWFGKSRDSPTHIQPLPVPAGSQLRALSIRDPAGPSERQTEFLETLPKWPSIEVLSLSYFDLTLAAPPLITFLAPLVKLQSLGLSNCKVNNRQLQLLMQAPFSVHLRSLHLSSNVGIAQGLAVVAHTCTALTSLTLAHIVGSDEEGVACASALAYGALRQLQHLDLEDWGINEETACHLANGKWNQLTHLDLNDTEMAAPAVHTLLKAEWLGNLASLKFFSGLADAAAMREFVQGGFSNLTYLEFGGHGSDGLEIGVMPLFQRAAAFPKLRTLHLACVSVTRESAAALSAAPWDLRELQFNGCDLEDSGLLALAQGNILRGLTQLCLMDNCTRRRDS